MAFFNKDEINDRYNKRLEEFGYDIKTLASGTESRRNTRFEILSQVGDLENSTILDLGCGFADLYDFLDKRLNKFQYTGYDINDKLISIAKSRHPSLELEVKDVLEEDFPNFDYVLSTSCFNLKMEDNYQFIEKMIETLYTHANKAVAIDFMTSYVDYYGSEQVFHYSPEKIFSIAKKFTKRVTLRHDYELFEFTIYMYKDFEGWNS